MSTFQIVVMISAGGDTDRGRAVVCVPTSHLSCDNLKNVLPKSTPIYDAKR